MVTEILNEKSDKIKVPHHIGTWYVINDLSLKMIKNNCMKEIKIFMLEHEQYGEDASHIFVNEKGIEYKQLEGYETFSEIYLDRYDLF